MSSWILLELEGSCRGSSSSPDEPESIDSKGFLKLSTVSQNCTSKDRCRRSMNSMRYDKELGFLSTSRSVKGGLEGSTDGLCAGEDSNVDSSSPPKTTIRCSTLRFAV